MLAKLLQRQKLLAKVNILKTCILFSNQAVHYISSFSNTQISFNVFHLFTDADKQPADNLSKVATIGIESFLTKTYDISKDVIYNIQQSTKGMGPGISRHSPRRHHAAIINRGNFNFPNFFLVIPTFSYVDSYLSCHLVHFRTISFLIFSGFEFIGITCTFRGISCSIKM